MAEPQAFVISPYSEPFNTIYRKVIKPALLRCGFRVLRADEMTGSTAWLPETQEAIGNSDLIVADVTGNNRNVYYEVGIASGLRKDVILLTQDTGDLPADTKPLRHIQYSPKDAGKLQTDLENWVQQSKVYILRTRRISPKVMTRGEIFENITDATFYMHNTVRDDKTDILTYVRGGRLIPPSFLYRFDRGTSLWVELCNDSDYHYYQRAVEFFRKTLGKIFDVIGDKVIGESPDLISLGPGNGVKDRLFLNVLIDKQHDPKADMYYYPYDTSASMISTAIREISRSQKIRDRMKVKAIVADFSSLRRFEPVYQYRPETNIFTLLGNTLGNVENETNFLDQIKGAMFEGDILIVEVRCKTTNGGGVSPGGSLDTNKKFDFTPLDSLGVDYEPEKLRYAPTLNRSTIPGSTTIIASYHDFQIPGDDYRFNDASLSYVHEYEPDQLKRVMEGLGFEVLDTFSVPSVACYILRKPAGGK